jgi:hypothetical protein
MFNVEEVWGFVLCDRKCVLQRIADRPTFHKSLAYDEDINQGRGVS